MLQNWEHGDYISNRNSPSKLTNQRTTYCSPGIGTINALHSRSQGDNQEKKKKQHTKTPPSAPQKFTAAPILKCLLEHSRAAFVLSSFHIHSSLDSDVESEEAKL